MTDQLTLATQVDGGFQAHCKATRRDVFLVEMGKVPREWFGSIGYRPLRSS